MKLIFIIYLLTVIIYFFTLRKILSKNVCTDIDSIIVVFLIILLGFIPIINILYSIAILIEYLICFKGLEPDDILKKILFVKDERDKKWH